MFRPNTAADLNEFPALGTPPTMNRTVNNNNATLPNNSSRLSNSYASTAGNNAYLQQQHELESMNFYNKTNPLVFGGGRTNNQFHAGDLQPSSNGAVATRTDIPPRSFSMDEFPALRSTASAFDNAINSVNRGGMESGNSNNNAIGGNSNSKPEQWLDYANLRDSQQQPSVKPNDSSESWLQQQQQQQQQQRPQQQQQQQQQRKPEDSSADGKQTDPYGLLGLLGVIRMTDPDRSMLALGSDLTTLGLDLNTADSIYSTFISPWSDTQNLPGLNVEPGYYLPACYRNVQATPPAHQRMRTFSDEILFYVFYCMPKDIAQEAAAQELYNRNWRYHKELGLWLTKEADENGRPVQTFRRASPNVTVDRGVYVFFDPTTWQKVKREWTFSWDAIEERQASQQLSSANSTTSNTSNPNLNTNIPATSSSTTVNALSNMAPNQPNSSNVTGSSNASSNRILM